MNNIITNAAAMTALQSLNKTMMTSLQQTQGRISTARRVDSAYDNAACRSVATTMRPDSLALTTVQDALNLGASTIDAASAGLNSAISVTSTIKTKLAAAAQPGVDRVRLQSEITLLQKQLKSIADSTVFSGQNWLSVDSSAAGFNGTKGIVSSYSHDASGTVSIGTIDVVVVDMVNNTNGNATMALFDNVAGGAGATARGILDGRDAATAWSVPAHGSTPAGTITFTGADAAVNTLDISGITDSGPDLQKLDAMTQMVDQALVRMSAAASDLGSARSRVALQQSFVAALKDSIAKGVGALVDADMTAEATRLQALQVQQQLGIRALSIANQSSQAIMKLFGS